VVVTLALGLFALASPAEAQQGWEGRGEQNKIDGIRFDVHADIGWWWAFGVGFRAELPIVPDGFIERVDDELAISFGGDVAFVAWNDNRCNRYGCWGDWSVWPMVAAQWNFYLTEEWSVFPELGGTVVIYDCDNDMGNATACVSGSPLIGFGARWHFAPPRIALLMRIIYPFGGQIGITF
jgi:hypothetical protein